MKSKELFEELGFKYYEDDGFDCYKKETQNRLETNYVSFNRYNREVFLLNKSKESGIYLTSKLIKAINKRMNELEGVDNE